MLNHFTFNGHSTGELGLLVSGINIYGSPSRVVENVNIPYRSGDLLIDTGAYTNYMLTYTVDIMDNTKATAEAISKWLLGSKGYCELTDTYNPEIYRVASYYNQLDYTLSALYRYGKATITFDCKPQKYLTANQPVTLSPTTSEATSYSLSSPAMPLPLTLEGNTTQNTLSGKNLLPTGIATVTNGGVTATRQADGSYLLSGTSDSANDDIYILSGEANRFSLPTASAYRIMQQTTSGIQLWLAIKRAASGNTVYNNSTFPMNDGDLVIGVFIRVVTSGTNTNGIKVYPQIELGSTSTTYEPYCGGIPSPNPDYPQEIHSVSGDNQIKVVGKNLLDVSSVPQGLWDGITRTISGGTITLDGTATKNTYMSILNTGYTDGTYTFSFNNPVICNTLRVTFRRADGTYFGDNPATSVNRTITVTGEPNDIVMYVASGTTLNNFKFSPQLEVGSTATTYEPYKAQIYPINLGSIELNGLSSFKDYIHKENGKWWLHKATSEITYNGSESWAKASGNYNMYYVENDALAKLDNYNGAILCDKLFTYGVFENLQNVVAGISAWHGGTYPNQNWFYAKANNITTVADWKTWLGSSSITIIYPLATPTETEITDATLISQLNALSKAKTYDGATNIVQDGNDAEFTIKLPVPTEITSEYFGEPIITVNEVGTIVWNDSLIKVNSAPVTINSQTLQCYYYSENKNNDVEINEFPKYEQGENYIGSTMALTVVPNYWKL